MYAVKQPQEICVSDNIDQYYGPQICQLRLSSYGQNMHTRSILKKNRDFIRMQAAMNPEGQYYTIPILIKDYDCLETFIV